MIRINNAVNTISEDRYQLNTYTLGFLLSKLKNLEEYSIIVRLDGVTGWYVPTSVKLTPFNLNDGSVVICLLLEETGIGVAYVTCAVTCQDLLQTLVNHDWDYSTPVLFRKTRTDFANNVKNEDFCVNIGLVSSDSTVLNTGCVRSFEKTPVVVMFGTLPEEI